MFTRLTRTRVAAMTAILCMGLTTGMIALSTGCATNANDYKDPDPAISAFTTGTMNGTTFTATTAGTPFNIAPGGSAWFRANFAAKDGKAIVTPGNIPVESNVPFQITNIATTTPYLLTVSSGSGKTTTATSTVTVLAVPANLTYSKEDATYYVGVQIAANTPTVAGATPMTYTINKPLPAGLSLSATTGAITGAPQVVGAQDTYTITATNAVGSTTRDIKIAVAATPITMSISPTTIALGQTAVITWDANSVAGLFSAVTITANPADSSLAGPFALAGTKNVTPSTTTTYTLSATPAAGGAAVTKTVDVAVGTTPVRFTSFTGAPSPTTYGGTSTLSWTGTGIPLVMTLDGTNVLGSTNKVVSPVRRQTYTLAGSNNVGGDTATTTVAARGLDFLAGSYGSGRGNVDGDPDVNGISTARFYRPNAIVWDEFANDGSMIVCDYSNHLVRRIDKDRKVRTIAGLPGVSGTAADNTDVAKVLNPRNAAVDPVTGDVYVGGEGYTTKRLLKLTRNGDGSYTPSVVAGFALNTNALVIDSTRKMYFMEFNATTGNLYTMDLTAASPTPTLVTNLGSTINSATAMAKDFNGGRKLLYVVGTNKIVKIDVSGASPVASLFAGTGVAGTLDHATDAKLGQLRGPQGVAVDTKGNVYIADRDNFAVRMVPAGGPLAGGLVTIAGRTGTLTEGYAASTITLDNSVPTSTTACLSNTYYVAVKGDGTAGTQIFVADAGASFDNQSIRTITVSGANTSGFPGGGTVYTLDDATKPGYAYAGTPRVVGAVDGVGGAASFSFGTSTSTTNGALIAAMPDGSKYFAADTGNNRVRIIAANGTVTTMKDAASANIAFLTPKGIAVQINPTTKALVALFVADTGTTKKIRKFTPNADGTFTEDTAFAITGGTFPAAGVLNVQGMAMDSATKMLYVSDYTAGKVFKVDVTASAAVSTDFVASTGTNPVGVALENGTTKFIWVAVYGGNVVKKYAMDGTLALTVGTGTAGFADGANTAAAFSKPNGIAADAFGNIYVSDFGNNAVRAIVSSTGAVSTLVGRPVVTGQAAYTGLRPGLLLPVSGDPSNLKATNVIAPQGLAANEAGDLVLTSYTSVYQLTAPANQ